MKTLNAYLIFNGNCREAMEFYAKCLGGDLNLLSYGEAPVGMPNVPKHLIMHARLSRGEAVLMGSDAPPADPVRVGSNFWVNVQGDRLPEIERIYGALREGGKVSMELKETFWAVRFGMLTDRFGINWMFNVEKPMGKEKP